MPGDSGPHPGRPARQEDWPENRHKDRHEDWQVNAAYLAASAVLILGATAFLVWVHGQADGGPVGWTEIQQGFQSLCITIIGE